MCSPDHCVWSALFELDERLPLPDFRLFVLPEALMELGPPPSPRYAAVSAALRGTDWALLRKQLVLFAFSRCRRKDKAQDLAQEAMRRLLEPTTTWDPAAEDAASFASVSGLAFLYAYDHAGTHGNNIHDEHTAFTLFYLDAVVGGAGIASLAVYGVLGPDGGPGDHTISKLDADLYVARYDRALLRKTIQDTKERMQQLSGKNQAPSIRVVPVASPVFTGIVGRF